jgi:hypothetical protein
MHYKLFSLVLGLSALGWFISGSDRLPKTLAQPTTERPEVHPAVLAFVKPVVVLPDDSELLKKLKQRHNVAVSLLEERVKAYKQGGLDLNSVFEAAKFTSEAKLDLAADATARITTLNEILEVAKLFEKHFQQQLEGGFGTRADLERARYARLSVEIELLKARNVANPEMK